jgi:sucrose-6-phosphate hydrolase SacC (GH32 family)
MDGRRVAFGWLQESVDELAGPDRSRVGVMSLPRELSLDETGSLRSWPARELDGAHRNTPRTQLISGRGTLDLDLSAQSAYATEIRVTPLGGQTTATAIRLAGRGCEDIKILVTADGIQVAEGNRLLTAATIPGPHGNGYAAEQQGQVRVYYDGGVVEVFSMTAGPAAVICNRHGTYGPVDVDLSAGCAGRSCAASVTTWSCGQPSAA